MNALKTAAASLAITFAIEAQAGDFSIDIKAQHNYARSIVTSRDAVSINPAQIVHVVNRTFEFGMDTLHVRHTQAAWKNAANAMLRFAKEQPDKFAKLYCLVSEYDPAPRPILLASYAHPQVSRVKLTPKQLAEERASLPDDYVELDPFAVLHTDTFLPLLEKLADVNSQWQKWVAYVDRRGVTARCNATAMPAAKETTATFDQRFSLR